MLVVFCIQAGKRQDVCTFVVCYNLNTKSGLLLYENAQEPLKVPFNGKAVNIQAFLNSLLIDVQKYHLEDAVKVDVAGVQVNLITDYSTLLVVTSVPLSLYFTLLRLTLYCSRRALFHG